MANDLERKLSSAVVESEEPLFEDEAKDLASSEDPESEIETDGTCCDKCENCAHGGELNSAITCCICIVNVHYSPVVTAPDSLY